MSGTEENHTSQGLKTSKILILECARKLKVFDILDDRRGQKSSRIYGVVVPEHLQPRDTKNQGFLDALKNQQILDDIRFSMALKDLRP